MSDTKRHNFLFAINFLATLFLSAVLTAPVSAHGGEDHGDTKPAVTSNQKRIITRTARTGDFEILLKHSPIEPDTETAAKLFITNFATNEPFADTYGLGEFSVFEVVGEQRRLTENTTLPASGFTPGATVLPDEKDVPQQINRKNFLKSLQTPILAKKKNRVETAGIQKSN